MKFEKISFEEFKKTFPNVTEEKIREAYNGFNLPKRSTEKSAGYDFHIPFNLTLDPDREQIIPTGVKVLLDDDKKLTIYPRSSLGINYYMKIANTVGIIDADYYNNETNEGHIFIKIRIEGHNQLILKTNDRFCQGIIEKYYTVDNEDKITDKRSGGIGHTGQ